MYLYYKGGIAASKQVGKCSNFCSLQFPAADVGKMWLKGYHASHFALAGECTARTDLPNSHSRTNYQIILLLISFCAPATIVLCQICLIIARHSNTCFARPCAGLVPAAIVLDVRPTALSQYRDLACKAIWFMHNLKRD